MWIFVLFTKKIRQLQAACLRINLPNGTSFGRNLLEKCYISPFLDFYSLEPKMKKWKVDSWYLWDIFLVEFLYKLHLVILIGFHSSKVSSSLFHLFQFQIILLFIISFDCPVFSFWIVCRQICSFNILFLKKSTDIMLREHSTRPCLLWGIKKIFFPHIRTSWENIC